MGLLRFDPEQAVVRAEARAAAKKLRGARPMPSARFLIKGSVLSLVVAGMIVGLAHRYSIAIAPQEYLCLPPYRIWIIDKGDREPVRGGIYAFHSVGLGPIFQDGTKIVKVLEGMPGDTVKVELEQTTINDQVVGEGLAVATEKGIDPQRYVREGVIAQDRYWFFGKTNDSFDSRYWGSVKGEQIVGRAYPIW